MNVYARLSREDGALMCEAAEEIARLEARLTGLDGHLDKLEEALFFYADVDSYSAILFIGDSPCGAFADDADEEYSSQLGVDYDRPMPGKTARAALRDLYNSLGERGEDGGPREKTGNGEDRAIRDETGAVAPPDD